MSSNNMFLTTIALCGLTWTSCKTLESGGKVVDKSRGEVVISAPANNLSALPEGRNDKSLTKARMRLEKSTQDNPKDIKSLVSLAQIQLAQERLSEAEETARKVLLLDTKNQGARKVLAQSAIRRENYDMALIFLSALGGEQSKDSDVFNMLGIIALNRGENDDAMRLWKQAISINPGDMSVRMNMGVMYVKNRLFSQAQTQFERVLKVAPNHQDARLHIAIIGIARGKNADAIETFQSILSEDNNNPLALFNLAVAQRNLAQYEDAVENLKKYVKASPAKSKLTDQAFALIDDINTIQAANNQKVSDEDVQALARDLARREKPAKSDLSEASSSEEMDKIAKQGKGANNVLSKDGKDAPKNTGLKKAADATAAQEKIKEQSASDSEIDALEQQLKSPAH